MDLRFLKKIPKENLLVGAIATFLSVRFLILTNQNAVNLLFLDNWDFYRAAFEDFGFIDTFTYQHGPHRQGIGFVLSRLIDSISSWNTRTIAFVSGILIIATAFLYWFVKVRAFGKTTLIDALLFIFVLSPVQFAIFANVVNMSHGPMPAILLAGLCASFLIKNTYVRTTAIVLINFNLLYSGFGFFAGIITPFVFVFDVLFAHKTQTKKRVYASIVGIILSVASLAVFFINYNFKHAEKVSDTLATSTFDYFKFIGVAFTNIAIANVHLYVFGLCIFLILLLILAEHTAKLFARNFKSQNQFVQSLLIFTLISFSLLFVAATAYGRIFNGVEGAKASRYIIYLIPAMVGAYFHATLLPKRSFRLALVGFIILGIFTSFSRKEMVYIATHKKIWKNVYLQTESVKKANRQSGIVIFPEDRNALLEKRLKYLREHKLNLYAE